MQVVCIVLNHVELLDDLLLRFSEAGITGATFVDGRGMAKELHDHNEFRFLGSLRHMFNASRKESKVIFTVVPDDKVATVSKVTNEVTGGLNHPETGILFAIPVSFAEGLPE